MSVVLRSKRCLPVVVILLIAATALPAFAQGDVPLHSRVLRAEFNEAYQAKNYDEAIKIGLQLTSLKPNDNVNAYNLACAYALHGETQPALKWLTASVSKGFNDFDLIKTDRDFDSIRTESEYLAAVEIVRKNNERRIQRVKDTLAKRAPLVLVPKKYDQSKPTPAIIAMHGFGGNADRFARVWKDAADQAGAILIVPNALEIVNTDSYSWSPVDEAEMIVMHALEWAKDNYKIDPERVILTGFSQGGLMAYNFGMRHADKFCGVIPVAGQYNPATAAPPDISPSDMPKFLIMVGDLDGSLENNRNAAETLKTAGLTIKLNVYEGVGHDFPADRVNELRKAVDWVLKR